MIVQFYCCDRCGQAIANEKQYNLKAFKNLTEPDGDYVLCKSCYCTLTSFLNKECTSEGLPKGLKVMDSFLKEFNNQFVIGE